MACGTPGSWRICSVTLTSFDEPNAQFLGKRPDGMRRLAIRHFFTAGWGSAARLGSRVSHRGGTGRSSTPALRPARFPLRLTSQPHAGIRPRGRARQPCSCSGPGCGATVRKRRYQRQPTCSRGDPVCLESRANPYCNPRRVWLARIAAGAMPPDGPVAASDCGLSCQMEEEAGKRFRLVSCLRQRPTTGKLRSLGSVGKINARAGRWTQTANEATGTRQHRRPT